MPLKLKDYRRPNTGPEDAIQRADRKEEHCDAKAEGYRFLDRFQWMEDPKPPPVPDKNVDAQNALQTINSLKHYIPGTNHGMSLPPRSLVPFLYCSLCLAPDGPFLFFAWVRLPTWQDSSPDPTPRRAVRGGAWV